MTARLYPMVDSRRSAATAGSVATPPSAGRPPGARPPGVPVPPGRLLLVALVARGPRIPRVIPALRILPVLGLAVCRLPVLRLLASRIRPELRLPVLGLLRLPVGGLLPAAAAARTGAVAAARSRAAAAARTVGLLRLPVRRLPASRVLRVPVRPVPGVARVARVGSLPLLLPWLLRVPLRPRPAAALPVGRAPAALPAARRRPARGPSRPARPARPGRNGPPPRQHRQHRPRCRAPAASAH